LKLTNPQLYALGFVVFIPIITPQTYLTLTLRSLKFSTFDTNLLVIPSNVWTIINLLALTWLSGKLNQRALVAIIQSIWTLPCVIALAVWPHIITNAWGTYAITLTTVAAPYCHAILVGWTSRNSNDVGTRSISTALYNMSVQIGAIAGSFVYREDDRPKYRRGNRTLIGLNVAALFLFVFTKVYYVQRNKWKKNKWDAMSKEEQNDYIRNSTDEGPARLDFQFAH
jgi:predicted MFS family arabinose efflux permease